MDWNRRLDPGMSWPGVSGITTLTTSAGAEEGNRNLEQYDRLHDVLRMALHGSYAAPLEMVSSILDVGCGSGKWTREAAAHFPHAGVTGIDVRPASAKGEPEPQNYRFIAANVLDGLPFLDATFDYVHMRMVLTCLPAMRWPAVVRELVRVTRPGGYVELVEGGLIRNGGPALTTLAGWMLREAQARGSDPRLSQRIGELLTGAGLPEVMIREIVLPAGGEPGTPGGVVADYLLAEVHAVRGLAISLGLTTPQEFNHMAAALQFEMRHRTCTLPVYVAYARR
jgi:ubiquinone/menaquinone biosynthesis C-methylase UbiE